MNTWLLQESQPFEEQPTCLGLPLALVSSSLGSFLFVPIQTSGKERYVFFSFPHIGIDSKGVVGNISRPGRSGMSCACGAVIKVRLNSLARRPPADHSSGAYSCCCSLPCPPRILVVGPVMAAEGHEEWYRN